MTSFWSHREDVFLADKAAEHWSALRIGLALKRSKNSVISRARRKCIELNGARYNPETGEVGVIPRKREKREPKHRAANVIRLVIPKQRPASPIAVVPMQTVVVERGPHLSVISNERRLIEDYIAKHGVRRFEAGQRADYEAIKFFLEDRGYSLNGWQGRHRIAHGAGRPKMMVWSEVIDLVDKMRAAEGLQTLRRQA